MKEDFIEFMQYLKEACKNMKDKDYFQINNSGSEIPIYRERIYCYELYHQLRCVLGDSTTYKLQSEPDKRGHRIIEGGCNPDFIFHKPGTMDQNLVVMEVKKVDSKTNEIRSDIKKLKKFLEKHYHWAIMLIYGDGHSELPENIKYLIKYSSNEYPNKLFFIWHPGPNIEPEIFNGKMIDRKLTSEKFDNVLS